MHPPVNPLDGFTCTYALDGIEILEGPLGESISSPSFMLPEELISITQSPSQLDSTKLPSSEDITGRSLAALFQAMPPEPLQFEESRGGKH